MPSDRVGSRYRASLGDQIYWWAWHQHRWRGCGFGAVQLVERPLPGDCRALARLSRASVPRNFRHIRLPDEAARREPGKDRELLRITRARIKRQVPWPAR